MGAIAALAHILFVAGLAASAILLWRGAGLGRRKLALFVGAVWLTGLLAVYGAVAARGPSWLSTPLKDVRFESHSGPLGTHHKLLSPSPSRRLPAAFARAQKPLFLQLDFQLHPSGRLQHVRVTTTSGSPDLDAAVAASVRTWRFGPLPAEREPKAAETVRLTVQNRYHAQRKGLLPALLATLFVGLWMLTVSLLPKQRAPADGASPERESALRTTLFAAGWLAALGWLIVWRLAPDIGRGTHDLSTKHAWFLLASVPLIWASAWIVRRWAGFGRALARSGWLCVAAGVVLLLLTRFTPLGTDLNTGHRLWLRTPIGVFQTVELVKLLLVFFVAACAYPAAFGGAPTAAFGGAPTAAFGGAAGPFGATAGPFGGSIPAAGRHARVVRLRPWFERYRGMIGAFALVLASLALMSDFGPMLLLAIVLLLLLFAQGHARQAAAGLALLLFLLAGSYAIGAPARWHDRVSIWRNPWQAAPDDSHRLLQGREHMARAAWAVSAGGITGAGLGRGRPGDIAAVESDFPFAAISEELGWIGGAALLAVILALVRAGLSLAMKREDALEKTLLSGIVLLLAVQATLSIGGNLGLWPLSGITLPFVSYGGSSLLVNFLALGILVGLAGRSADPSHSFQPLPADLSRRSSDALRKLQIGLIALPVLLSAKAAWMQSPWTADAIGDRLQRRADTSHLANPRAEAPPWVDRGRFLDRSGAPLTHKMHFTHLVGFQIPGRPRVGLESSLSDLLVGRLTPPTSLLSRLWTDQPHRGYDVVLTIDQSLQARAYDLLRRRGYAGSIVGIDPQTGEVLIAANLPALEPTAPSHRWLASYDGERGSPPFCYRKVYAPGSAFKTIVAAAALESGALSPTDRIDCQGSYRAPGAGKPIRDWQRQRSPGWRGHGPLTLHEALVPSCNSIYAEVGVRLGWEALSRFADRAGFNRPISLAPETWRGGRKRWFETSQSVISPGGRWASELSPAERDPGSLAQTALGQRDVRMTPLHLALWAAAVANDGKLMAPTLVRAVQNDRGKKVWEFKPQMLSRAMSQETANQVTAMMEDVVARGTGRAARVPGLHVAGKTGTPQEDPGSSNAIFIGFAPVQQPRLAVAVVLEKAAAGGGGDAAPIAGELLKAIR